MQITAAAFRATAMTMVPAYGVADWMEQENHSHLSNEIFIDAMRVLVCLLTYIDVQHT